MKINEKVWKFLFFTGIVFFFIMIIFMASPNLVFLIDIPWFRYTVLALGGILTFFVVLYKMREHTDNKITLKSILYTLAWIALFGYLFGGFRN